MHDNYIHHIVPCEYKYTCELKYLVLLTNFNRSTGAYAPEFTVCYNLDKPRKFWCYMQLL